MLTKFIYSFLLRMLINRILLTSLLFEQVACFGTVYNIRLVCHNEDPPRNSQDPDLGGGLPTHLSSFRNFELISLRGESSHCTPVQAAYP